MLGASGEQAAVRTRFIGRYLAKAGYFAEHLTDADQLERFRELRREHNNLRAALQYTLDAGPQPGRHRQGAELAIALSGYWHMSGLLREGRYWLAQGARPVPRPVAGTRLGAGLPLLPRRDAGRGRRGGGRRHRGHRDRRRARRQMLIGRGYGFLTLALTIAASTRRRTRPRRRRSGRLTRSATASGSAILDAHLAHLSHLAGDPEATLRYAARGLGRFDGTREWWSSAWTCTRSPRWRCTGLPGGTRRPRRAATRSLLAKHELGDMVGMAYCLEIHGWLAARARRHARAAWLLGAADPLWTRAGGRLAAPRPSSRCTRTRSRPAARPSARASSTRCSPRRRRRRSTTWSRSRSPTPTRRAAVPAVPPAAQADGPGMGDRLPGRRRAVRRADRQADVPVHARGRGSPGERVRQARHQRRRPAQAVAGRAVHARQGAYGARAGRQAAATGCRAAPARARSPGRAPGSCPCRSRASRAAR